MGITLLCADDVNVELNLNVYVGRAMVVCHLCPVLFTVAVL
jgi:hypothetical protein